MNARYLQLKALLALAGNDHKEIEATKPEVIKALGKKQLIKYTDPTIEGGYLTIPVDGSIVVLTQRGRAFVSTANQIMNLL